MPGLEFRSTQPGREEADEGDRNEDGGNRRNSYSTTQGAVAPNPGKQYKRPRRQASTLTAAEPRAPVSSISVPNNNNNNNNNNTHKKQPKENGLLLGLSEACKKHSLWHQQAAAAATTNGTTTEGIIRPEDVLQRCQTDLAALRKILPKVEQKICHTSSSSNKRNRETTDPLEAAQLSHFYRDVLCGGYCPHAPGLFQTPEGLPDGGEIFQRVQYLFQQLASAPLMADTKLGAASDQANLPQSPVVLMDASNYKACHRPVLTTWVVEKAVAFFLQSIVTNSSNKIEGKRRKRHWRQLQYHTRVIQQDLIQTMMDLAILARYIATTGVGTTSSRHVQQKTTNTDDLMTDGEVEDNVDDEDGMQILLFPKTTASVLMEQHNNSNNSNDVQPPEYVLDINCQNDDAVFMLQSSVLNILIRWRANLEKASLKAVAMPTEATTASQQQQPQQDRRTMVPVLEEESIRDLLASLRPMFMSSSVSMLAERARSAALELLRTTSLIFPSGAVIGEGSSGMDISMLIEAALLIVHGVGGVLLRQQQWRVYSSSDDDNISKRPHCSVPTQAEDVLQNLTALLRRTVLFPPLVRGYTSDQVTCIVRQAVLMPLLEECLPWIRTPQDQSAAATSVHSKSNSLRQLEEMTLRTIHACLLTKMLPQNILETHADPVAIVGPLLDLLTDTLLSPCSLSILAVILAPLQLNTPSLCAWCWSHQGDKTTQQPLWTAVTPPPPPPYPTDLPQQELLPVVQGDVTSRPPTNSSTVGIPNTSMKKSKRRPSLLGNNPLMIRSPTTKRRRRQGPPPFSLSTASLFASQNTPGHCSCFVEDLLRFHLMQGLLAAQSLSDYISSDDIGTIHNPREIMNDARMLSGCTRLLFSMLQFHDGSEEALARFHSCANQDEIVRNSSFLVKIADNWRTVSTTIHNMASLAATSPDNTEFAWTPAWEALSEIAINCGLHHVQHVHRPYILESKTADAMFREAWSNCCSALCLVQGKASQIQVNHSTGRQKTAMCSGTCRDILGALAIDAWNDVSFGSDVCLCDFLHTNDHHHHGPKNIESIKTIFSNDCAIMMFSALPLATRSCILETLGYQKSDSQQTEVNVFNLPPSWASLQRNGSLFEHLLQAKPLQWNDMTVSALVLAPLQILAAYISPGKGELQKEEKSHLAIVLNEFLRTVVFPAIDTVQTQDILWRGRASNALLVTIRQIQWLHLIIEDDTHSSHLVGKPESSLYDLLFTLRFLRRPFTMELHQLQSHDLNNPNRGAYDALRREVTFRLSAATASPQQETDEDMGNGRHSVLTPSHRLLKWKCVAWECLRLGSPVSLKQVMWLVRVPFSDSDESVRDHTSNELGKILLGNNGYGLFSFFCDDDEGLSCHLSAGGDAITYSEEECFSMDDKKLELRQQKNEFENRIVSALFAEIDGLMADYCGERSLNRHLSDSSSVEYRNKEEQLWSRLRQISAIRVLSGFCRYARIEVFHGKRILEESMLRLVKLLSGHVIGSSGDVRPNLTASASFGELARLSSCCKLGQLVIRHSRFVSLLSDIVSTSLLPNNGLAPNHQSQGYINKISAADREQRYCWLLSILRAFIKGSSTKKMTASPAYDVITFLHKVMPLLLAQMVISKDYDSLRLYSGFQLFLHGENKASRKRRGGVGRPKDEHYLGIVNKAGANGVLESSKELEKQTRTLCEGVMHRMLPTIFMKSDRSNVEFFSSTVLQGEFHCLRQKIIETDQPTLKELILNLGGDPDMVTSAKFALRAAALIRNHESLGNYENSLKKSKEASKISKAKQPEALVSQWVTSKFLYLVVNVIQFGWKTKANESKLQALRCLNGTLTYLLPEEATQYFPSILSTVNLAIEEANFNGLRSISQRKDRLRMQLLAVQALAKFCHIVAEDDPENLGQQLTSIVVSLIPVLSENGDAISSAQIASLKELAAKVAIGLMEWLTQGELGKAVAKYFEAIPFLPVSGQLEGVRSNLRANGVSFDNLIVTTQGTQQQMCSRETRSDGGSVDGKAQVGNQQAALSKRIDTVCALLSNENVSTRKVILRHLLDLLRTNRTLFHSLIQNGGSSPAGRFLTVDYESTGKIVKGSSFSITEMMGILLAQCVFETDSKARELLGATLGEIGAIDSHRLGTISMSDVLVASDPLASKDSGWRLSRPPWKSEQNRYELQLVTHHLVVAMKAAPTSSDQHKIAFSIQQMLQLLDNSAQKKKTSTEEETTSANAQEMSSWLKGQLLQAGVLDVVEPFWSSKFGEKTDKFTGKTPPFFQDSSSYWRWLSDWCRFMIMRSHTKESPWRKLFYACRTAVRTPVGLGVAEFILPLLVLDCLCFGGTQDYQSTLHELKDVFSCKTKKSGAGGMNQSDRRKAVDAAFMVVETLQHWAENEKEERRQLARPNTQRSQGGHTEGIAETWTADDCVFRIENLLNSIPLLLRAEAAQTVGMHARALRTLEMSARSSVVDQIFNATSDQASVSSAKCKRGISLASGNHNLVGGDWHLMKEVLAELNNYETMAALDENSHRHTEPLERTMDSIRQNEAAGNWEGALRDYERAAALSLGADPKLKWGALRCLLKLGQFDSVLNQVQGIMHTGHTTQSTPNEISQAAHATPFAVEAAWRLGRWDTLSDIIGTEGTRAIDGNIIEAEGRFKVAHGWAMLSLHRKNANTVATAVKMARRAVMDSISSVARESYERAYPYLVRLQCLREIEDSAGFLCSPNGSNPMTFVECTKSEGSDGWGWQRRLELVSPASSGTVINTRLGLARLARDPMLEGSLFLSVGTKARKNGLFQVSADALAQAEGAFNCVPQGTGEVDVAGVLGVTRMQVAKMKHDMGQSTSALKILGDVQQIIDTIGTSDAEKAKKIVVTQEIIEASGAPGRQQGKDDDIAVQRFATRVLQSTKWVIEGGLKDGAEIMNRFRLVHKLAPDMEKGHLQFAKYVDSIIQSRTSALTTSLPQPHSPTRIDGASNLSDSIVRDSRCQMYIALAMEHYDKALRLSSKHLYQTLPRLLSLYFEFMAIQAPLPETSAEATSSEKSQVTYSSRRRSSSSSKMKAEAIEQFKKRQHEAYAFMVECVKNQSPKNYFTVIPQLIAQIMHSHTATAQIAQYMLKKVLIRFPEQAMWPLAWLLHSKDSKRRRIGGNIFSEAQKNTKSDRMKKLLIASQSLIRYLHALAQEQIKTHGKKTSQVQPWRGEVPLMEFMPPIQEALTAVFSATDENGPNSKDLFPREVPRMRGFSSHIQVMASKAKPKKVTAYIIPAAKVSMIRKRSRQQPTLLSSNGNDIGQIHFLVKEEAKGDLRKDARVQDLNTVINRLMASSRSSGKYGNTSQHRQLRLRTFAVTCLSEETGILEWVPETSSLRSLIEETYNPQADEFSAKRRGARVCNFSDSVMRTAYETKCQDLYFKHGNLTRAGALFEELLLKEYPPVFFWWFVQKFQDPHAWYEARTLFTLSAAVWSGVGHVMGLGDRHSENILIDTLSGECVHVDFDCIFDKGQYLPKPEVIPFRLTANMLDAFGPTGADGVYTESLKLTMKTLRDNRDTLLSVLEPFINDPIIDWKRARSSQSPKKSRSSRLDMTQGQDRQTKEAKLSIKVLDGRLRGIYNLRNPNAKKIKRTDGWSTDQNDDLTQLMPLSVEGQVHKMIAEATSSENLVQLYVGWMPWI